MWHIRNNPYLLGDLLRKEAMESSYSEPAECQWESDACQFPCGADQSKPTFVGFKVSPWSLTTLTVVIRAWYNYLALHLSIKYCQSLSSSPISQEMRLSNLSLISHPGAPARLGSPCS